MINNSDYTLTTYCEVNDCFEQGLREKYEACLTEIEEHVKHVQQYVSRNLEDDVYSDMDIILQKIKEAKKND